MDTLLPAPTPIHEPFINRLGFELDEFGNRIYTTGLRSIDHDTNTAWDVLWPMLVGIDALASNPYDIPYRFGRVARVEFFFNERDASPKRRGAVLFDTLGKPIVSLRDALLGYGGSGPALSESIMTWLGVTREMFDEANSSVAHQSYVLVFSRQLKTTIDGVETAQYTSDVGDWSFWRAG